MGASLEPFPRETSNPVTPNSIHNILGPYCKCERFRSPEVGIRLPDGHSNFRNFDDVGVNTMRHRLKAAAVASEASLFTRLTLRATMTIDTLDVIAF